MAKTIAAGIFIVNSDKKVLICHPTNHPADFWSIPKGKVEAGEELIDAAIRETFEETNIDLKGFEVMATMSPLTYSHKKKVLNPYILYQEANPDIDFNSFDLKCNSNVPVERGGFPEMDDYRWVSFEEAKRLLHSLQANAIDKVEAWCKAYDGADGYLYKMDPVEI
jgi:8-oxo-dGTP pyrophosphatase MutT (NUDIX family)